MGRCDFHMSSLSLTSLPPAFNCTTRPSPSPPPPDLSSPARPHFSASTPRCASHLVSSNKRVHARAREHAPDDVCRAHALCALDLGGGGEGRGHRIGFMSEGERTGGEGRGAGEREGSLGKESTGRPVSLPMHLTWRWGQEAPALLSSAPVTPHARTILNLPSFFACA